jgi:dephospho-CoA kinase
LTTPPTLGLIGAIGAGKSTAARCLAELGGHVIDCDKLGHEALEDPAVKEQLVSRWGKKILLEDGRANRRVIGEVVFNKPAERKALEAIVFPVIGSLTQARLDAAPAGTRFHVLDAAVLLEAGWGNKCDRILYIDAPRLVRIQRLLARSGWSEGDITAREAAQWPAERKMAHSQAVIVNDVSARDLHDQLIHVLNSWNW